MFLRTPWWCTPRLIALGGYLLFVPLGGWVLSCVVSYRGRYCQGFLGSRSFAWGPISFGSYKSLSYERGLCERYTNSVAYATFSDVTGRWCQFVEPFLIQYIDLLRECGRVHRVLAGKCGATIFTFVFNLAETNMSHCIEELFEKFL